MAERKVDVAIIGAGTAGLAAYRRVREHTERLVLIEGGRHGTTCARVGCMPSKLLIAAADAAHAVAEAPVFGVHAGAARIDGREVMARVRDLRDYFVGSVLEVVEEFPAAHRLAGHARFIDDHRLQVGDDTVIEADRVVIATGSRPSYPALFAEAGDLLATSDDVFEWDDLPHPSRCSAAASSASSSGRRCIAWACACACSARAARSDR
jgi:dihydrolipoamide dehydrogenase